MSHRLSSLRRAAIDVVTGLSVFLLIVCAGFDAHNSATSARVGDLFAGSASARELSEDAIYDLPVAAAPLVQVAVPMPASAIKAAMRGPRQSTILLAAAVISILVMFNVGFVRHLRRVYASPRRDGWRRG